MQHILISCPASVYPRVHFWLLLHASYYKQGAKKSQFYSLPFGQVVEYVPAQTSFQLAPPKIIDQQKWLQTVL